MANKFTFQTLRDTTTDAIIKLTGTFDSSTQETANGSKIVANSLYGALATNGYLVANSSGGAANTTLPVYNIQLTGLKYFVNFPTNTVGSVEIYWNGAGATPALQYANSATILHLNGDGEYGMGEQIPAIYNNSINGNGDIGIQTQGAIANCSYTLIISLRKDNAHYQRGQFNDPAAFNFGQYSLKP